MFVACLTCDKITAGWAAEGAWMVLPGCAVLFGTAVSPQGSVCILGGTKVGSASAKAWRRLGMQVSR